MCRVNSRFFRKVGNIYRLDYYDKDGNHKEIHGFKTAECCRSFRREKQCGRHAMNQ